MSTPGGYAQRLTLISLIALLTTLGYAAAVPIWDSDFWWHIAAGRAIWQDGGLPDIDPFGVYGNENPIRNATVLKGQWLGQLLLYGIYQFGGATAIVLARVALLTLSLLLVLSRLRQANVAPGVALLVLALAGFCLLGYTGDRPQLFSIFFAALTFWFVDRGERHLRPLLYYCLPLIALLWANIHGGVVLASILLALHAAAHCWGSRSDAASRRNGAHLLLATALFAGATLLTPNGLDAYAYIFNLQGSDLQSRTSEYTSALKIYQFGLTGLQAGVGLALLCSALGLLGLLRAKPGQALLVGALIVLSVESFRYLVFLLVVATPYVVVGLGNLAARLRLPAMNTAMNVTLAGTVVTAGVIFTALSQGNTPRGGINPQRYPADLIRPDQALQGRIFNFMDWGGYLLWHAPELLPYIDGRMLDDQRLTPYTHMLWATPQGQAWFEQASFAWVLIPYLDRQGKIYGLNAYLEHHPRWQIEGRTGNMLLYRTRQTAQAEAMRR